MSHVDKLKDLVYTQKRTVSLRDICYSLNVHVSQARKILDDFVAEESKKEDLQLDITYLVTGSGLDSSEDYKIHKLTYAKIEELDEVKKGFETVISCKVFSISLKDQETVPNDEKVNEPLLDRDDFLKQQKLTYIVNDDILLRPDRLERLKLTSGIQGNGPNGVDVKCEVKTESNKKESVKESKTETKKDTKSSNKRTTNRRNINNKKQSKLSGFGSKIPKNDKTNSSGDSGFSIESTPDPFSDEEEEKSPEREEEEEAMEVEPSPASPSPSPASPDIKDESEDEAIVMEETNRKKESKKRKRVRVYDSDEEDEETLAFKILAEADDTNSNHSNAVRSSLESNKSEEPEEEKPMKKSRKKSKSSQPMETKTVSEEYIDEEGYTQVRLVKKLVPVEEKSEEKKPESIVNGVKENNRAKKVKTEKPVNKKQKTEEVDEEEETKPKTKKLSKAAQAKKGQVSITNFFKPAAKV